MDCEVKIETKVCKECGYKTDNPLVTVCPRCTSKLPGPQIGGCSGACFSCGTTAKH